MKQEMNLLHENEHEKKIKFFSHNKVKFQPRT